MRWLQFILSHSIFISLCAVALCYQTFTLLHLPVNYFIYGLVFFATLSSYNAYWLISKYYFNRHNNLRKFFSNNLSNVFIFLMAAAGLIYCMYFIPGILPTVTVGVLLTILYSIPLWPVKKTVFTRKAGFLKTLLLAFTWAYVTVMIPAGKTIMIPDLSLGLLFTARFLFMLMLCIIFDSRDINIDKIHSLGSLATDVSRRSLRIIMLIVFIFYLSAVFLFSYYFDDQAQVIAFFITGLLAWGIYLLSLKKQGYFFYYFLVDGLMLFSSLATFLASI